jgi:hypothetical protein
MLQCNTVQERIEEVSFHAELAEHLRQCPGCNAKAIATRRLRNQLRQMPTRPVPAQLTAALQVIASQEMARTSHSAIGWTDRTLMFVRDLMRPFAVPAFGGLASAVVLFSALMPSFATPIPEITNDVPLMLVTEPSVKNFPAIGIGESELVVDVAIDGAGRMVDYTVVRGASLLREDASLKSQLENSLLFTEFVPATKFGGPASGNVRLRIKSSQIHIRG